MRNLFCREKNERSRIPERTSMDGSQKYYIIRKPRMRTWVYDVYVNIYIYLYILYIDIHICIMYVTNIRSCLFRKHEKITYHAAT